MTFFCLNLELQCLALSRCKRHIIFSVFQTLAVWKEKTKTKQKNEKNPLISPPLLQTPGGQGYSAWLEKCWFWGKTSAVPCAAQQMARVCWWFSSKAIELLDAVRRAQLLSGTGAGNRYFLVRKGQRAGADVLG